MASIDAGRATGRRANLFRRAERHSRLVRRLRWLLPGLAGAALVLFVGGSWLASLVEGVSVGPIRLQGTSLVMANPRLAGFDRNRRPYEIIAEQARQDIREPRKIELQTLDARLEMAANGRVRITSDRGFYDGEAETFRAEQNVRVTSTLGYEMLMENAFVNIRAQSMETERPVEGRNGENRIFADRLRVTENGDLAVFEGNVRVIYQQRDTPAPAPEATQ